MRNALVPVAPIAAESTPSSAASSCAGARANADFVAHLIATAAQLPQTRARRRAEPEQAVAAYRALGHWPTAPGGRLSCRR